MESVIQINEQRLYGKKMGNLRNKIDVKLINNEKDYLKYTSKPSYMLHKIFGNNLVAIRKRKVAINLHTLECVFWN